MITLYGMPNSRSTRVSWTLEELGLEWQFHYLNFEKGEQQSPEYLALNPSGKIPSVNDDGLIITESAAICIYLAEKYNDVQLLPEPGSAASARCHQWLSFVISELEQPLWTMGKHRFALPEEQRVEAIFPTAKWEFDKAAGLAEQLLGDSEYAAGDSFTVADIFLCHTLLWAVHFEQTLPPKLDAYFKRVSQRPALAVARKKEKAAKAAKA